MLFDSGSVWIPIIMHVLVGLLSLAALAALTRSSFLSTSQTNSTTRSGGSSKAANGRRTRRKRGDSKSTDGTCLVDIFFYQNKITNLYSI